MIKKDELNIIIFFRIIYIFNYPMKLVSMSKIKIKELY